MPSGQGDFSDLVAPLHLAILDPEWPSMTVNKDRTLTYAIAAWIIPTHSKQLAAILFQHVNIEYIHTIYTWSGNEHSMSMVHIHRVDSFIRYSLSL